MSCITRSSFRFNKGCVSWILMLHIGQYLLVWRYLTIQLLQTRTRNKRTTILFLSFSIIIMLNMTKWSGHCIHSSILELTGMKTFCNCSGINKVSCTQVANDVFIQVLDFYLHFFLLSQRESCHGCLRNIRKNTKTFDLNQGSRQCQRGSSGA